MAKAKQLSPTQFNAEVRPKMAEEAPPIAALSLADRIKAARDEAEAFIDLKVAELKASPEGATLPVGVLRQQVTRHSKCACAVVLRHLESKS
jgi:hypothetical protein